MYINKIIFQSTNLFLVLFILFTVLPVKLNFSSIIIIILTLLGVLNLIVSKKKTMTRNNIQLFLISIPFIIYMLGLINTSNFDYASNFLVRNLSFIAFPLIFFSLGKYINPKLLFKTFLLGLSGVNLYLIYLFFYYYNFGAKFYMIITVDIYHSTYLGMYNLFAYWVSIYFFSKSEKKSYGLWAIFFLIAAIISSARIIFILAIISLLITVLLKIKTKSNKIIALILVSLLGGTLLFTIPSIKQKFKQVTEIDKLGFDKNNYQSISSRFGKINASTIVLKNNLWFGTGTGDMIDELVKEYESMNFVMGYKYRYNPHNQYLDNIVRNGLIGGGISLLAIYILPIVFSLLRKDFLMLAFILIICFVSLTESILDVHKGITFYVFFITLLLHKNFQKIPNISNNTHDSI